MSFFQTFQWLRTECWLLWKSAGWVRVYPGYVPTHSVRAEAGHRLDSGKIQEHLLY